MGTYRVYRSGEEEHVREAAAAARVPPPLNAPAAEGQCEAERAPARRSRADAERGRWWVPVLAVAVAVVGAALLWLYGREAIGNAVAAVDIAKLTGKVPGWAMIGAPTLVVVVIALATGYLAFGRHVALKIVGVVAVVVVLAAPGFAVGYANGLVGGVDDPAADAPDVVASAAPELAVPLPHQAMNILLIGSDKSTLPGDPGRSDTQLLVRLDPETKSIAMLSVPRDLRVEIPDHGYDKMNTAYSYGGPAMAVRSFKRLTGLPINHFIEVNFAGFWHVVNILGGVYLPIDHRYFVPASADFKSINLEPGYQLVHGKQALNFVRFRHDQKGDFTRMQRQQLFLKELQRQSGRWSGDWAKVIKLIKAIAGETTSDLSSLRKLQPLVELAFAVDTAKVYQVHLEGATPMIYGISYVTATDGEIAAAVAEFTDPTQPPVKTPGLKITKKMYRVNVHNGSGIAGLATTAATGLKGLGYRAKAVADAPEFPDTQTVVYATEDLADQAQEVGHLLQPSRVEIVARTPGTNDDITVFLASSFDGTIEAPKEEQQQQTLLRNERYDWETWRAEDKETPLRLEAPTAWSPGFTYDEFRHYNIVTTEGKRVAAAVAVISTPGAGYCSIQATRWLDPPAIENPNGTQRIAGTKYLLFYQGDHLHMVAWKHRGALYWLLNTLDNQLSNELMMGLATSCKPVK